MQRVVLGRTYWRPQDIAAVAVFLANKDALHLRRPRAYSGGECAQHPGGFFVNAHAIRDQRG
jgi:hypothetical protein